MITSMAWDFAQLTDQPPPQPPLTHLARSQEPSTTPTKDTYLYSPIKKPVYAYQIIGSLGKHCLAQIFTTTLTIIIEMCFSHYIC